MRKLVQLKESAELLSEGASADIWYDAREHGDTDNEALIDSVQCAMIDISKAMPLLLEAVEIVRSNHVGNARAEALLAALDK